MANAPASSPFHDLMDASADGDLHRVKDLLQQGVSVYNEDENLRNPLMAAAAQGHLQVCKELLNAGAPWNAIDVNGHTAGEFALAADHQDVYELLLNHGCRCELILEALKNRAESTLDEQKEPKACNEEYLTEPLEWNGEALIDSNGDAVMMGWEAPLMKKHAEALDVSGKNVLNIGFGLGIIDTEIQSRSPLSHTIVEAHPDVYKMMIQQGWDQKEGVTILFGRWQEVLLNIGKTFDAIFFDTFGEYYDQMREFHDNYLLNLLTPMTGKYSFFNGLAAKNIFFHEVYCRIAECELRQLGLKTEWTRIDIDPSDERIWEGVKRKYWTMKTYNLPLCSFMW